MAFGVSGTSGVSLGSGGGPPQRRGAVSIAVGGLCLRLAEQRRPADTTPNPHHASALPAKQRLHRTSFVCRMGAGRILNLSAVGANTPKGARQLDDAQPKNQADKHRLLAA